MKWDAKAAEVLLFDVYNEPLCPHCYHTATATAQHRK